ncbi:VapC toxin family PIN domain ribonuclease, partial [Achromobacter xylosoxidans]|nr:VapC toxin family PIN domain ribonuclease [Achromobacter xylosoxidans]
SERLFGKGIGYVDLHLLASTRLTPGAALWTRDKRLQALATTLGLAVDPPRYH